MAQYLSTFIKALDLKYKSSIDIYICVKKICEHKEREEKE